MKYNREKLWDYVHGLLDSKEELEIKVQLESDEQLRSKVEQIRELKSEVRSAIIDKAPVNFADKVITAYEGSVVTENNPLKTKVNVAYMRLIYGVIGTALTLSLVYFLININWSSGLGMSSSVTSDQVLEFLSTDLMKASIFSSIAIAFLMFLDSYLSAKKRTLI